MSKLIAVVAVLMLVDGVRTEVQPGEEVTGLNPHDKAELLRVGAVKDEAVEAADVKSAAADEKKAAQEFAKARKAVQAEQASMAA